jgi:HEAT repeat protein
MKSVHSIKTLACILLLLSLSGATFALSAQDRLTPRQRKIEQQRQRLASSDVEERRDALMKLGAMNHPDAAHAAVASLQDSEPIIRATAIHAIAALPAGEAIALLLPLTKEKLEFVRREAVDALGRTEDRAAVAPLLEIISADKEPSVRAAAALALGRIHDESAVNALTQIVSGAGQKKKREDDFVMRAAAEALGEIHSRAAVNVLIAAVSAETNSVDLRRAAAKSLGMIGDQSAKPALETALGSGDPYLSAAARDALRRLRMTQN